MTRHLLSRLSSLVPIWLLITFFAFLLATAAPGDPALAVLNQRGVDPITAADLRQVRAELHLDDPFAVRYVRWLGEVVRGDLGTSFKGGRVLPLLASRFGASLQLAVPAFVLALAIGLGAGFAAAAHRDGVVDHLARLVTLVLASVPSFWLGYLLIIVLSVKLQLLPVAGRDDWRHVVMPATTLALGSAASLGRLVRASVLDELGEQYMRTARAKGLSDRDALMRHAARPSLVPVVTVAGLRLGRLLAGAAIVETVFSWPGIGRLLVESINDQDYPVIQGIVLFTGTVFVLTNLVADLICARIDPRIRLGGGGG
ncbi:MAG TPA: ABC transporter permease [Acidimicrobiales bacterium]|jgi:ABC-type dipeptide/oligopeptide/nickel transport system permease component|nr:ABC transporter permease [Acidimicrobiales bacterium]